MFIILLIYKETKIKHAKVYKFDKLKLIGYYPSHTITYKQLSRKRIIKLLRFDQNEY